MCDPVTTVPPCPCDTIAPSTWLRAVAFVRSQAREPEAQFWPTWIAAARRWPTLTRYGSCGASCDRLREAWNQERAKVETRRVTA